MQTIPASEFIHLGDILRYLCCTRGESVDNVIKAINLIESHLNARPFEHINRYLQDLGQAQTWLHATQFQPPYTGRVADDASQKLAGIVDHLRSTLYSESAKWQTIILNQSAVSAKLRALESKLTFDDQKALLADTIRCLEGGAPRAAIVMGWNLTYEYLRRWVFEDTAGRLATFNALLTTRKRNKTEFYEPIADYDHFQDLGERNVLDWLFEGKIIEKGSYQLLVDALNRRNHFAHPSFAKASDTSSAGYIEHLIINIFDDPRFAY